MPDRQDDSLSGFITAVNSVCNMELALLEPLYQVHLGDWKKSPPGKPQPPAHEALRNIQVEMLRLELFKMITRTGMKRFHKDYQAAINNAEEPSEAISEYLGDLVSQVKKGKLGPLFRFKL